MHGLSDFIYLPLIGCCCYSSRSSKKRKKAKRPVMQQHRQTQKPSFFGRLSRAHWYWASILSHRYPFLSTFSPFLCLLHSLALISSMATTRWARERFPSDALFRSVNSFRPANGVAESRWRLPRKDFIFFRCYLRSLDRRAEKTYLSNLFNFGSVFILYSKR
jgi:hypothetical protein